jgi:hypothetical protein
MRKEVPLLITFLAGLFFIADYFIPHTEFSKAAAEVNGWVIIVTAFAYVLGAGNIIRVNIDYIQKGGKDTPYKIIMLVCLLFMSLVGIIFGIGEQTVFGWFYTNTFVPMQGMMFALLAFFIASAAFRAFRIRSLEASLLAITAVIVMVGRVPIGEYLWGGSADVAEWIMNVPQLAGKRAILIGAALGAIVTGLKVIVGLERTYLGQD